MQEFRTIISTSTSQFKLQFDQGAFFIGSCFAEHIAEKLLQNKFQILANPFGIIFNPISIADCISKLLQKQEFQESQIFYSNEMYKSFFAHSKLNRKDKDDFQLNMNNEIEKGHRFLITCSHLFITFGTAQVYEYKQDKIIVANNHKLPLGQFDKKMLSVEEIIKSWKQLIAQIKQMYPNLQICFSVSPVRHLRIGFAENMLSKSILIQSIHKLIEYDQTLIYFPAYEIMMDDLRDYRFYNEDMIHPNATAINYIFEIFKNVFVDQKCNEEIKEIEKIYAATLHRPFDMNSNAHLIFKQKMLRKINQLQERNTSLDFADEINHFSS